MSGFEELFGDHRVLAILRGMSPQETVEIAGRLWDAGVQLLEVPIGQPDQVPSLAAAVAAGTERGCQVGAGTVITAAQVQAAAQAGARYTVAPGFDAAVLAASLAHGMPHLPGVGTATEVQHAHRAGCQWVKVFPAEVLGPAWIKAIHGPFPQLRCVATGGMAVATAATYLEAGARVVGIGSALADPDQREQLAALLKSGQ